MVRRLEVRAFGAAFSTLSSRPSVLPVIPLALGAASVGLPASWSLTRGFGASGFLARGTRERSALGSCRSVSGEATPSHHGNFGQTERSRSLPGRLAPSNSPSTSAYRGGGLLQKVCTRSCQGSTATSRLGVYKHVLPMSSLPV